MSSTVDVNVLVYASDGMSPFHDRARELVERMTTGPEIAYLFWPTLIGYVRIATHPTISARPLSMDQAMANVTSLIEQPHIRTPGEQEHFWHRYATVAEDAQPTGNLVTDAHLVALMLENGVRTIWTHDRDFRRFTGIEVRDPFA